MVADVFKRTQESGVKDFLHGLPSKEPTDSLAMPSFKPVGGHFADVQRGLRPEFVGYHIQIIWILEIDLKSMIPETQHLPSGKIFRR